jgi:hypothetical protein
VQYRAESDRSQHREEAVWTCIIIRQGRDRPMLSAALEAGDPIVHQIHVGVQHWLRERWLNSAAVPSLCLTCEHQFHPEPALPPRTFAVAYSEDPRVNMILMSGVCPRCALKTDTELLAHAGELVRRATDGRMLGFHTIRPSPNIH